jgi:uncharacterized membrane protein
MDEDERRAAAPLEMGSERVEAFSDGVMAVIITILALELRPPSGSTLSALRDQVPSLFIYITGTIITTCSARRLGSAER